MDAKCYEEYISLEKSRLSRSILNNRFNPADYPVPEPDFDPVGMERRTGQDLPDDPAGLPAAPLVLFLDNIDC